ncbi:glycosyltransferase family 4 protein [Methanoculleus sp. UBA413]|jgi:glycosyltransferase involved in cell wall biosynthesis|uniref:glycosyltransferase family 4 protein n=1 Tax=Methanoculleus sp. UBA413 TaxID=1915509 RepID=UPI00257C94DE|nr:glycosyltransferase family 4 protein [Methanoculleus sp. UBA413]
MRCCAVQNVHLSSSTTRSSSQTPGGNRPTPSRREAIPATLPEPAPRRIPLSPFSRNLILKEDTHLKIAYVYDAVYPWVKGGVEKRIHEVSVRLADRGHEVHVYGMRSWDGPSVIERDGVVLHGVCPGEPLYSDGRRGVPQALRFGSSVLRPLLASGADVIDCQNFPYFSCFSAKAASVLRGVPLVVTWHEVWGDYWYDYLGRRGVFGKAVERLAAGLSDYPVAVSPSTARALAGLGVPGPVPVVPNGIDLARIAAIAPAAESSDVIFTGRLIREKNVDVLLRALVPVREEVPDLRALVVGDGPERPALERLARDLGLAGAVRFTGFLPRYDDVIAAMKASRVFVLPSTREGFGIAALEAMACGLPVVTADHPGNAAGDLVVEGVNGYCSGLSAGEMGEGILAGLDLSRARAPDCRDAAATYDWGRIVEALEKVYQNI